MAVLAKKIHIKNSAGTEQTVTLYSTTAEVATASGYTFQLVDGVTAYAALVPTSHARATSGRVLKSGTTYAWGSATPAPTYAYKTFTTAGSGTFTVPTGVTKLRVTCVGGGAAGVCSDSKTLTTVADTKGGTTTFGSVSAAGAKAASWTAVEECSSSCSRDTCGTTCWINDVTNVTVSTGTTNGIVKYTCDYYGGAGAVALTNYQGTTIFSAGNGGCADGDCGIIATGGSGYKKVSTISVTPGQTISWSIASPPKGYRRGTRCTANCSSSGWNACPGGVGGILVEYGSGIE